MASSLREGTWLIHRVGVSHTLVDRLRAVHGYIVTVRGVALYCAAEMIQLLFLVLFVEGAVAFLLLVKIGPLRELVIKSLDQVKMGKRPATVKTIAGTMSVILFFSLMNIVKIQNKGAKLGTMSPMDQVLWRTHLLEASLMGIILFFSLDPITNGSVSSGVDKTPETLLHMNLKVENSDHWRYIKYNEKLSAWPASQGMILVEMYTFKEMEITIQASFLVPKSLLLDCEATVGFTLFLGFLIDRMHHYLSKLIGLRRSVGSSKEEVESLQKEKMQLKEKEDKASMEIKLLLEQISTLSENLKKLKLESENKDKQIETAEAHVVSLQKQCADLLLEYDRLLEDNQNLQARATGHRI
ncbi:hypothetical protein POTOM_011094 [Populus tomentosa]|uniref:Endoplasmic reticulum transmembrane protein n=1 Tax=Populus tomentosa TaxID=118781 RepID=A0A8X8DAU9_POPTO|nr:hypothetical protein POTOM_011094 [Populus tomentosa]